MSRTLLRISIAATLLASPMTWAESPDQPPIVAVFQVQDKTGKLPAESVQQITDYLATKLGEGGLFRILPSGEIRQRLQQEKRASYKACYDQKCQIEIGRELAAQKTVSSQIVRIGSRCAVLLTLFDLRRAAAERSSSQKAACDQDPLIAALDRAAAAILAQFAPKRSTTVAQPAPRGMVALRSKPYNAQVEIDGKPVGRTPIEAAVTPGQHQIEVALAGHESVKHAVQVEANRTVVLDFDLPPLQTDAPPPSKPAKVPAAKLSRAAKPAFRYRYLGVASGLRLGLGVTDDETNVGDLLLLIGGKRFTFEGGVTFGNGIGVRAGVVGQLPLRPWDRLPLYLIPMVGYFYTYNPAERSKHNVKYHDVMIYSPGLRLRYDLFDRLAVMADLIQVDISVVRIYPDEPETLPADEDWDGERFGGVQWNMKLGLALLL